MDCAACDFPGLRVDNLEAWEVIQAGGAALVDGMRGIRLDNARLIAEALGYRWDRAMMRKITTALQAMLEKDDG